jgi:hypothetical protein
VFFFIFLIFLIFFMTEGILVFTAGEGRCFGRLSNRASADSATVLRQAQQPCFGRLSNRMPKANRLTFYAEEVSSLANLLTFYAEEVSSTQISSFFTQRKLHQQQISYVFFSCLRFVFFRREEEKACISVGGWVGASTALSNCLPCLPPATALILSSRAMLKSEVIGMDSSPNYIISWHK